MSRNQTRIDSVFADLEKRGIIARPDFSCCNGCASGELEDEVKAWTGAVPVTGYVFFHEQATDSANDGGSLWLAHGSLLEKDTDGNNETEYGRLLAEQERIAEEIVREFREHGFTVNWDGNLARKIAVLEPLDGWNLDYGRGSDDEYDDIDEDDDFDDQDD